LKLLVRVAIIAALVWLLVEVGLPWLARRADDAGLVARERGGAPGACAERVEDAVERFGEAVLPHLSPPVDLERWERTLASAEDRSARTREECRCDDTASGESESCRAALEVLDELEAFQRHVDDTLRSGQPPVDFARRQEALLEGLERARRSSR
jgi:hypothetical protein